jgi:hypothetical protein
MSGCASIGPCRAAGSSHDVCRGGRAGRRCVFWPGSRAQTESLFFFAGAALHGRGLLGASLDRPCIPSQVTRRPPSRRSGGRRSMQWQCACPSRRMALTTAKSHPPGWPNQGKRKRSNHVRIQQASIINPWAHRQPANVRVRYLHGRDVHRHQPPLNQRLSISEYAIADRRVERLAWLAIRQISSPAPARKSIKIQG